jgi:ketosteroid isomerase-like protein
MTDYADESRFFSHGGVLHGSDSIRKFYGTLFEEFEKPGMSFDLLQQEVDDDTAYIVWKAETADNLFEIGTDRGGTTNTTGSICRVTSKLLRIRYSVEQQCI